MPLIPLFFFRFHLPPHLLQARHPAQATRHHVFALVMCSISTLILSLIAGGMLPLFSGPAFPLKASAATTCPNGSTASSITGIQLNEVLTNPRTDWNKDGNVDKIGDQWIELANLSNSTFQMPLQLCDSTTREVLLPATLQIPAHGFYVIYGNQITFPLFLGGGQLVLLDGSGLYIDSINYPSLLNYPDQGSDLSYSRQSSGVWDITSTPTPGSQNSFTTPGSPTPTSTATPRSGKGGGGGGGSGGKATVTPTASPVPASSVVLPSGSALASQQDDSATDTAGSIVPNSSFPSWLKIALLAALGAGLLVVIIWYIRSWNQEPESDG